MRNCHVGFFLAFSVVMIITQAPASDKLPLRSWHNPVTFLEHKIVREELHLSDEQWSKLRTIYADAIKKRAQVIDRFGGTTEDELDKLLKPLNDDFDKAILEVFTKEQIKRYNQLDLQSRGPEGLCESAIQKELHFTEEQKARLNKLREEGWNELKASGFRAPFMYTGDVMKKFAVLWKKQDQKACEILSEDQRKTWNAMRGKLVDLNYDSVPHPVDDRFVDKPK